MPVKSSEVEHMIVFDVIAANISSSRFTTGWLDIGVLTIECMCCI